MLAAWLTRAWPQRKAAAKIASAEWISRTLNRLKQNSFPILALNEVHLCLRFKPNYKPGNPNKIYRPDIIYNLETPILKINGR